MDGVYSSWTTRAPGGFNYSQITALERLVSRLALVIKSVSLAHMTATLMETYLGRERTNFAASRRESTPLFGSVICEGSRGSRIPRREKQFRY